jgi:glucosylceramidase
MPEATRRQFLKGGAAGAALLAAHPALLAQPGAGAITVEQSSAADRFQRKGDLAWTARTAGAPAGAQAITVDSATTYQEVLGFGAAMTDAATFMIDQLAPAAREQFLHELFAPEELGINIVRTCVGASDFSREVFSYDEGAPDPELTRFSIERDQAYLIPQLLRAREIQPQLFVLASPWSPPGWMKNGGSMLGGNIKPANFPVYARYLVKYLQAYHALGVPIHAMTSQNEVDTEQAERMPACAWAQEHEVIFVSRHLGPALAQNGLSTKIWLLDHNFNLWGRVYNTLEDPEVFRYVDGVAWHPYVGSPTAMTRIHEAYPSKHQYWTEGKFATALRAAGGRPAPPPGAMTPGGAAGAAGTMDLTPLDTTKPAEVEIAEGGTGGALAMRNWARCVIDWNVALDEHGTPNIGPFVHSKAVVTIHSETKEITRNSNYWVIKHYNHAARRGAKVIQSTGEPAGVAHAAFHNPDGRICLVLSHLGSGTTVDIRWRDRSASIALPANSVTNLSWS